MDFNLRFLQENQTASDSDPAKTDPASSSSDDAEVITFVSTEFFYNLLPCYIFILASLYRFITIYRLPSFRETVQTRQQEQLLNDKTAEEEGTSDTGKAKVIVSMYQTDIEQLEQKTAGYYIKTRISMANAVLYIISVIFAFAMPPSLFSAAIKPIEGLFYLFGLVAWLLSWKLLALEWEKGLSQEIYTHRFFWVFTGSLALIRIFQRSERPICNLVINSLRFFLIFFLMIYAIFKPFDREVEMGVVEDEMPTWARSFFDRFEGSKIVAGLVGYKPKSSVSETEREMSPAQAPEALAETNEKFRKLVHERRNSNVVQNVNQEQFLLKNLPKRRVVGLSKLPIKKLINKETKVFYQILTQINQNQYISEKKYADFLALEKELTEIYNDNDFPNLAEKLPILEKVNLNELADEQQLVTRRIEFLEKFLQSIFKSPAFVHPKVLSFLEIAEDDKSPFLAYFSYISKGIYKNRRSFTKALNDVQSTGKPRRSSKIDKSTPNPTNFEENRLEKAYKKAFVFEIACVDWQKGSFGDHYEFVFGITDQTKFPYQTWRVSKTLAAIRDFHTSLENKTGNSIPFFARYVPKTNNNDKNSLNARKEGLNKYIKEIAGNKNYYCDVFFDFIEFDPIRETPFSQGPLSRKASDFEEISYANLDEEFYFTFEENSSSVVQVDFPKKLELKTRGNLSKEKKLVSGIDFSFAVIKVVGVKSTQEYSDTLTPSGKKESIVHYYLNLEEYYDPATQNQQFKLKTVIKVKKRYIDFSNLYKDIWAIYRDIQDISIPSLPAQKLVVHGVTKFDPKERKQTWEGFFFNLLRIPRIEENESFKEFFNLQKIEDKPKYLREAKEIHDFT